MSAFKKNHFSPEGLLLWNYVFETDSGDKYSDDKYKVTFRVYGDEAKEMIELIDSFIPEAQEILETSDDVVILPYKQALDKEKKPIDGAFDFTIKTKNKPQVVDGKRNRVTEKQIPGYKKKAPLGKGIVAFKPHAFSLTDRKGNTDHGIGLYLQAVQILELSGGGVDLSQFEEHDDGFVVEDFPVNSNDGGQEDDIPDFAAK